MPPHWTIINRELVTVHTNPYQSSEIAIHHSKYKQYVILKIEEPEHTVIFLKYEGGIENLVREFKCWTKKKVQANPPVEMLLDMVW